MATSGDAKRVEQLLETPALAEALENDQFKQFLDQVPVAIAVSELKPSERIVYANVEFERLTGQSAATLVGEAWDRLPGVATEPEDRPQLGRAITEDRDHIGAFTIEHAGAATAVDAWSNIIEDDHGASVFRLVALVERAPSERPEDLEQRIQAKDVQLMELQHRVKNNLQMITALIRIEARGVTDKSAGERFDRLAGRIEALGLLYRALTEAEASETVDLGIYLSEVASAVMRAHAVEGIHLNLQVDTWPVSIDVAMPAGLVVNELLTNALKHAFAGRAGGTITLQSLVDDLGCRVVVADDGVGLPEGASWPKPGKLSALIVRSLLQNARASIEVTSTPGEGMRVIIFFARADAVPSGAA
ncbi:MAG TPA: histidine kinase dimerization/phosphoacceptor domain -containing protein [Phenylobacterium sp.]|nr:histidine kinase dimerization/phosphoacceptor domain -containing protein [Phenylobacterium sp.]